MRILKRLLSHLSFQLSHWQKLSLPSACSHIVAAEIETPEKGEIYGILYPEAKK
jgi:hypothetical protein